MRMLRSISKLLIVFYLSFSNVWAVSDAEILKGLEILGDWEAAYPLARQLAKQQNTYQAWKQVAVKYAQYDTDKQNYLKTWQLAQQLNQLEIYKDFITLYSESPLNLLAIQAIFKLTQASDDVNAYRHFMMDFPASVEALQALLRVQEIAFSHAQQVGDPDVYDRFVVAFPNAKQTVKAIENAYVVEKQSLEVILTGENHEEIEYIARRLFNEARMAEKESPNSPTAARKYRLLNEIDAFKDTKVFTELLDREERLAYQKLMLNQQTKINESINQLQAAVVQAIQAQTQVLGDTIAEQTALQTQKFDQLIATHQQMLDEINKVSQGQTANTFTSLLTGTTTIASNLTKNASTEGSNGWCNIFDVTGTVGGFVPIVGSSVKLTSVGAEIVCKSLPHIVEFFDKVIEEL